MKNIITLYYKYYIDIFTFYLITCFLLINGTPQSNYDIENYLLSLSCGFLILGIYLINKISDIEEDTINKRLIIKTTTTNYLTISILFLLSFFLYTYHQHTPLYFWFFLFILGVAYSFPKKYRLKKILFLKNLVPVFWWYSSICITIFSISDNSYNIYEIAHTMFPYFMFFLVFSILFDFPDIKGDRIANIKTIPVLIGLQKTKIFLYFLLFIMLFTLNSIEGKIISLILIIFLINTSEKYKKIHYQLLLTFILCIKIIIYFYISK